MELYSRFTASTRLFLSACQKLTTSKNLYICSSVLHRFFNLFFSYLKYRRMRSVFMSCAFLCGYVVDQIPKILNTPKYRILMFYWGSGPSPFLPMRDLWMWGMTPPPAMVALIRVSSSSSPRIASCRCLGVILFTFKSFEALPANSST